MPPPMNGCSSSPNWRAVTDSSHEMRPAYAAALFALLGYSLFVST